MSDIFSTLILIRCTKDQGLAYVQTKFGLQVSFFGPQMGKLKSELRAHFLTWNDRVESSFSEYLKPDTFYKFVCTFNYIAGIVVETSCIQKFTECSFSILYVVKRITFSSATLPLFSNPVSTYM